VRSPHVAGNFVGSPVLRDHVRERHAPAFVDAAKATGQQKMILAGVATDLCVALTSLDLTRNGFEVVIVAEMAGLMRVSQAGATLTSWVGLGAELMRDWTLPPVAELKAVFDRHIPAVVQATAAAQPRGSSPLVTSVLVSPSC
jgi:hypothetical protein